MKTGDRKLEGELGDSGGIGRDGGVESMEVKRREGRLGWGAEMGGSKEWENDGRLVGEGGGRGNVNGSGEGRGWEGDGKKLKVGMGSVEEGTQGWGGGRGRAKVSGERKAKHVRKKGNGEWRSGEEGRGRGGDWMK